MGHRRTARQTAAETDREPKDGRTHGSQTGRDAASPVRSLQRSLGNQAVRRLVERERSGEKAGRPRSEGSSGGDHDRSPEVRTSEPTIHRQEAESEDDPADDSSPSLDLDESSFQLELDADLRQAMSDVSATDEVGDAGGTGQPPRAAELFPDFGSEFGSASEDGFEPLPLWFDPSLLEPVSVFDDIDYSPEQLLGLEDRRSVYAGGINPNRAGSGIRAASERNLGENLSLTSERELTTPDRTIFGQPSSGLRVENYAGVKLGFDLSFLDPVLGSFSEGELELGQNVVVATGELGDLETQQIGRVRLQLGAAEIVYRNDHDFFELVGLEGIPGVVGGGTDQGLTAAVDLGFDLRELDLDRELIQNVYLEQVGLSLELNTGEPLQYGARADEVPVYDPELIRHPEVDRGDLTLTSQFRHRPSDVAVTLGAGVNSSKVRDYTQGDVIHDPLNVPRFPVRPYLEFTVNVGVSVPF